jgi:uncharacterized protein YcfJ
MTARLAAVALACAALSGCVVMPAGPSVASLPGSTKPFDQFQADDQACRDYAQTFVVGPSQAASNTAAANTAAGTAIGAAIGALIGSASASAGPGAAIGAATGLLFGSAYGANTLGYASYDLQRQYDGAYLQCMYAHGNKVPVRTARPRYDYDPRPVAPPPAGYPPPDPNPGSVPPPDAPPPV